MEHMYGQTFRKDSNWRSGLLKPDILTGSEILLRTLLLEEVDCVFGYPGGVPLSGAH